MTLKEDTSMLSFSSSWVSKNLTSRSLPEIGRRFGNRDHTTVLHAIRKVEQLMADDTGLKEEVELLKRLLQD